MTPDAAGVVAQVDAALLLALVVESKAAQSAGDDKPASSRIATSYAMALFSVFLSLGVTLASVAYDKPLTAWPTRIALGATVVACTVFFNPAFRILVDRGRSDRRNLRVIALIMLAGLIWFAIWVLTFVPNPFIWQWF